MKNAKNSFVCLKKNKLNQKNKAKLLLDLQAIEYFSTLSHWFFFLKTINVIFLTHFS